ncbi:PAS domain-containing hybrid sensor histidine kinase/response regulator [Nocardioides dongxiaopingii]|uniref:PAS domain-containing hybrid sensor histidine kinase/response regulator n=1 Tax=Nocardioides dongxiaopingii TaxID=2576036 RepID=UPI0010C766A1|nr:PAS domain-containing hybrid sensor histidine kinase/response regulator [Nocardioides dongxiaopingii]
MPQGDLNRQIVESFTDGIVALELDGTIRFANPSAESLLGVAPLQGLHMAQFLDEAGQEHGDDYLGRAAAGEIVGGELDTMLVRHDGSPLWVKLRQTALVDGDRIAGVILRLTDNHETKQLLEAVNASRERLVRAERIARSGSWTWDVTAAHVSYSDGLVDLYGEHTEALMGRRREALMAITHPEDHQRMGAAIDGLASGATPVVDLEVRQHGREGWMWVRLRALGTYDAEGRLVEASGTYQDVTRARDTEDQLHDLVSQNSLMQAVATAANEATSLHEVLLQARLLVLVHDDWTRARAFVPSPGATPLVPLLVDPDAGYTPVEEPEDPDDPDAGARELATAEEAYRRGEPVWDTERRLTIAFPVVLDDEVLAVLAMTSRPPLYRHDMIRGMVEQAAAQLTRVAERERAAGELAAARDRAVRASEHKSDFLATMSHEIRTPLNGIIGLNELLQATDLSDRQQHLVSGIAVSSRSLIELTNDILDFAKIEAGRLEVESVDFEVREVLAEVANVLAESARARDIELLVSCSPDLPGVLAGDPVRLKQVLLNLGSNAVKFTASGSVEIRATAEPPADPAADPTADPAAGPGAGTADAGTVLRVEVSDTGMGISPTQLRHIFSPFAQGDTSTTRRFGGTGLGLAISSEIVAAFGGEIGVESHQGVGSTFWFTARLGAAHGGPVTATLARARRALEGRHVLVVGDEALNRTILREQLGWWGMATAEAGGSPEELASLAGTTPEGHPYDVVLLDLAATDPDRLARATAAARAAHPDDPVVILITSAAAPPDDTLDALGITVCLTKPVPSVILREVLLAALVPRAERDVAAPPATAPSGRGTVLVVEDNAINQLVARGLLEALGYAVETADDGEEALVRIEAGAFDAVLMDVQMPRLDGYDTTRALRRADARDRSGGRLPILAMTAAAVSGERERCLAAGMDDFITKPVSPTGLGAALARWVDRDAGDGDGDGADGDVDGRGARGEPASVHLDHERLAMLLDLRPDDTSYLDRAIGNFLGRHHDVVETLTRAVQDADPTVLVASAHSLRGSAGNLGLPVVAGLATSLEELGRLDTTTGSAPLLADLVVELDAACRALERYQSWYRSRSVSP